MVLLWAARKQVWSGEGKEKLFQVLLVHRCVFLDDALLEARGDDGEPGPVECLRYGCELGDDVLAVPAFFKHAGDRGQLALGSLQTIDDRGEF
uniref:Uncharacterized protein n=1 Tax=Paenarthrobacter aurescens TaxID=43663 RepID=Q6SKE8_PAEAU|nr:hypothetical protein [Paenarthrobacter aurescens]